MLLHYFEASSLSDKCGIVDCVATKGVTSRRDVLVLTVIQLAPVVINSSKVMKAQKDDFCKSNVDFGCLENTVLSFFFLYAQFRNAGELHPESRQEQR